MGYLKPPDEYINAALETQAEVPYVLWDKYLEWMNNKPMTERESDQELRDGCILTGLYRKYALQENDDE